MRHMRRWTAAAALAATAGWAAAQDEKPAETPPDARKTFVERRTEQVLGPAPREDAGARSSGADLRKEAIEVGTAETLRVAADAGSETPQANPRVAPGLVRWHADLAAARAAARVSGKPVLVFQMLGNLDDEFC